ncbi:MAG: hypothetical protein ACT4PV_14090, partial [Planctomycetaceae bacterium]
MQDERTRPRRRIAARSAATPTAARAGDAAPGHRGSDKPKGISAPHFEHPIQSPPPVAETREVIHAALVLQIGRRLARHPSAQVARGHE